MSSDNSSLIRDAVSKKEREDMRSGSETTFNGR